MWCVVRDRIRTHRLALIRPRDRVGLNYLPEGAPHPRVEHTNHPNLCYPYIYEEESNNCVISSRYVLDHLSLFFSFPKLITFSRRSRSLWSSRCAMYDSGSGAAKALETYFIKIAGSFLCLSLSLPLPVFLSVELNLKTSISNFLSQSTDGVRPLSILSSLLLRVFMCAFSLCISDTITSL